MVAVLVIMLMTPGMAISAYLIPVWIAILGIGYLFKTEKRQRTKSTIIHLTILCPSRHGGHRALLSGSHFPFHSRFIHIVDLILQRIYR